MTAHGPFAVASAQDRLAAPHRNGLALSLRDIKATPRKRHESHFMTRTRGMAMPGAPITRRTAQNAAAARPFSGMEHACRP